MTVSAIPVRTVRAINPLGLLSFILLTVLCFFLTRALFVPSSVKPEPPSLSIVGTVFTKLQTPDKVYINEKSMAFLFEEALLTPVLIQLDLSSSSNPTSLDAMNQLSVYLLDDGQAYLSFHAYAGEVKLQDKFMTVTALLINEQGQSLNLYGKLEY